MNTPRFTLAHRGALHGKEVSLKNQSHQEKQKGILPSIDFKPVVQRVAMGC